MWFYVDNAGDLVIEAVGGNDDTVVASKSWALGAGQEVETLKAIAGTAAVQLTGNDRANHLLGNDGSNVLAGGAGADRLEGGLGSDTCYVDDAGGLVIEAANGGTDSVIATVGYTLADNVGNLTLVGASGLSGTGNRLVNRITGSDGGDTIDGGGGNDTILGGLGDDVIVGGPGSDTLWGGAGADRFVFGQAADSAGSGRDRVMDFSHAEGDRIDLSAIDANGALPGDSFTWVGTSGFHGIAGELRYQVSGSDVVVSGDMNGDKVADISFTLAGVSVLSASDILL